jgi:hypothetical protein
MINSVYSYVTENMKNASFEYPTVLDTISLGHMCQRYLPDDEVTLPYLLLSSEGAITHFHTDMSGTSVMYAVISGEKWIYMIPATTHNLDLFDQFTKEGTRRLFFASHILLEGSCQKLKVKTGDVVFIGPQVIHMVVTTQRTRAIGINFLHVKKMNLAADVFIEERMNSMPYNQCHPNFVQLISCFLSMCLNGMLPKPNTVAKYSTFAKLWDTICAPRRHATSTDDIIDLCVIHDRVQAHVSYIWLLRLYNGHYDHTIAAEATFKCRRRVVARHS